jgi:hypothetical protein
LIKIFSFFCIKTAKITTPDDSHCDIPCADNRLLLCHLQTVPAPGPTAGADQEMMQYFPKRLLN